MPTNEEAASAEREQTDESLRVEREKSDLALAESLETFEEVADSVISLARQRADEVLAAARAKVDRQAPTAGKVQPPLARERAREDLSCRATEAASGPRARKARGAPSRSRSRCLALPPGSGEAGGQADPARR